jgi:hypothetical protein
MSWWELGEHSGYAGKDPISRITCAFCGVGGNFSVKHPPDSKSHILP